MLTIGPIDNTKIIAASVNNSVKPNVINKHENGKEKTEKTEKTLKSGSLYWITGATALASLALAGIGIYRSRKNNILKAANDNPFLANTGIVSGNDIKIPSLKPAPSPLPAEPEKIRIIDNLIPYDEKENALISESENKIRSEISKKFLAYRDNETDIPLFKYRPNQVVYKFAEPIPPDIRELDDKDFEAVMSFLNDYKYNAKMRAGMELSDVDEVKRLKRLIDEAIPLENEAIVYRGIRTQKIWDNFETLDFAKNLEDGVILKDRAFVSTSRVYDDYLAQVDPANYEGHTDCGYIMRIILPKGTKGFDCRRCSGRNLDKGINSVFILPPDSNIEIQHIDDLTKIIYSKYIIP